MSLVRALDNMVSWLRARYDRLIALVVFGGLLGSLLFLAVRIGRLQRDEAAFRRKVEGLVPTYPQAAPMNPEPFRRAAELVQNPPQITGWTNALTVPEIRVWCVDCGRPIAFNAETCPFCLAVQPPLPGKDWGRDSDRDGIPDLAEQQLGLDPRNPADASEDADGDLFSNLDEFLEQTDIRDAKVYPAIEKFIELEKIDAIPFSLLFKSYMRGAKTYTFQINTRRGGRTYFAKLGEEIDGFQLMTFNLNVTTGATAVAGGREDRSELVLKKGERTITLIVGQDKKYDDYTCHFRFRLTDTAIRCKVGDTFELRPGRTYEAMRVDTASDSVVIGRAGDGVEFIVGKAGTRPVSANLAPPPVRASADGQPVVERLGDH